MSAEILANAAEAVEFQTELVANNLARSKVAATAEFRAIISDNGYQTIQGATSDDTVQTQPIQKGTGVAVQGTQVLFKQGILKKTDYEFDAGIQGKGFVELTSATGVISYARLNRLTKDKDGNLCMNGKKLTPEIQVPADGTDFEINASGEVKVMLPGGTTKTLLGQIELVSFTSTMIELNSQGEVINTDALGDITRGVPGVNGFGEIKHRYEEQSTINVTSCIIELVGLSHKYALLMKAIHKEDQRQGAVVSAVAA